MIAPPFRNRIFVSCIPLLCGLFLLLFLFAGISGAPMNAAASLNNDDATATETSTETATETPTPTETISATTSTPTETSTPTPITTRTATQFVPIPTTPAAPAPTFDLFLSPTPERSPTVQTTLLFTWTVTSGPPTATLLPYPTVTLYFPEKKTTPGMLSAQRPANLPEKAGKNEPRSRSTIIWSVVLLTGLWFFLVGLFLYSRKRIE